MKRAAASQLHTVPLHLERRQRPALLWIGCWLLLLLAATAALWYEPLYNGALTWLNQILSVYAAARDIFLPPFSVSGAVWRWGALLWLAGLTLSLLLLAIGNRRPWLLLLPGMAGIALAALLAVPLWLLSVAGTLLLFCFCLLCLDRAGNGRGRLRGALLLTAGALLAGVGLFLLCPPQEYAKSEGTTAMATAGKEQLQALRYENKATVPLLAGGALDSADGREFSGETVLRLSLQRPQAMYWRGFIGQSWQDNCWQTADSEPGGDYLGLFDYLQQRQFYPSTQLSQVALLSGQYPFGWVVAENLGLSSDTLYAPAEATATRDLAQGTVRYDHDQALSAPGLTGQRSYVFDACVLNIADYGSADLSPLLQAAANHEDYAAYAESELIYRTYVYNSYLSVPSSTAALLRDYYGETELAALSSLTYQDVTRSLRRYFYDNFSFTFQPGTTGDDDALSAFLANGEGYQPHFATLATLLYRMAGIPARYAEGCVLTGGDVSLYSDMSAIVFELPDSSLHAWVEIYVDGAGWLPVEISPGYYLLDEETPPEPGIDDLLQENPSYFYLREEQAPPESEEDPAPTEDDTPELPWQYCLCAAVALLLLLLALTRLLYRRRRRAAWHQQDTAAALLALYRYAAHLLRYDRCRLSAISAYDDLEATGGRYDLQQGSLRQLLDLTYQARYGPLPDTVQRDEACRYTQALSASIRRRCPLPARLWHTLCGHW